MTKKKIVHDEKGLKLVILEDDIYFKEWFGEGFIGNFTEDKSMWADDDLKYFRKGFPKKELKEHIQKGDKITVSFRFKREK